MANIGSVYSALALTRSIRRGLPTSGKPPNKLRIWLAKRALKLG